jgi:hypothetical protein
VLCPVCLQPAYTSDKGIMLRHDDGVGIPCLMSGHTAPSWDEESTRPAVQGRSGGICEYCLHRLAQDMHHRKSLGVGGTWHPANILHLCRICHRFITEHPNWARSLGLIVRSIEDPSQRPVTRENGDQFQPSDEVAPPFPKGLKKRAAPRKRRRA